MKRNFFAVVFFVVASFMFSSCLSFLGRWGYVHAGAVSGSGGRISTETTRPGTSGNTDAGATNNPGTGTATTPSTTKPSAGTTTNSSDMTVVMEAWSTEYHYLFYKNGTVSIMDFNDKELSRPKYTSSSNVITINGEKFKFEDQSDNFESVPHKIGTLVKI